MFLDGEGVIGRTSGPHQIHERRRIKQVSDKVFNVKQVSDKVFNVKQVSDIVFNVKQVSEKVFNVKQIRENLILAFSRHLNISVASNVFGTSSWHVSFICNDIFLCISLQFYEAECAVRRPNQHNV